MDIPGDCILNAPHPYPVSARNATGQLLPDLMMGCLHQVVPERVAAEGSSTLWNTPMRGGSAVSGQAQDGGAVLPDFEIITFHSGGTGARRTLDGLDGTAFPSGVRTVPVEAIENVSPLLIWRKEIRPDSGGPGRTRGGFGQIMEMAGKDDLEFACNAIFDRVTFPPMGRDGGQAGAAGGVQLKNAGTKMRPKGFQVIPNGDRLLLHMPGGGGMGPPSEREAALVARDLRAGLGSAGAGRECYRAEGFAATSLRARTSLRRSLADGRYVGQICSLAVVIPSSRWLVGRPSGKSQLKRKSWSVVAPTRSGPPFKPIKTKSQLPLITRMRHGSTRLLQNWASILSF